MIISVAAIVGAACGYIYWYRTACSGDCFIGSSPIIAMSYGAFLFGMTADEVRYFMKKIKNSNKK